MNDRDLLEAAAKAAGIDIKCFVDQVTDYDSPHYSISAIQFGNTWETWNPLEDDGDAFRLAVKLNIDLMFTTQMGNYATSCSVIFPLYDDFETLSEVPGRDPFAATRRAIVRAAAMIGSK